MSVAVDRYAPHAIAERRVQLYLDAYIDWLVGFHEAGWAGISPMWSHVLPGGGSGEDDAAMVATMRLRRMSKRQQEAQWLLAQLPPRQRVALVLDTWRAGSCKSSPIMTRRELCDPVRWQQACSHLSLTRRLNPCECSPMTPENLAFLARRGRVAVVETLIRISRGMELQ